jgi:hypothetical protein
MYKQEEGYKLKSSTKQDWYAKLDGNKGGQAMDSPLLALSAASARVSGACRGVVWLNGLCTSPGRRRHVS